MNFEQDMEWPSSTKRVKVYRFEVFKGILKEDKKLEKICSLGHAVLFEGSSTYSLYLKTLVKDQFYLLPNQDGIDQPGNYVIFTREPATVPGKKYFWNRVGTGKLLDGENSGILKLDFYLFTGSEIYMSFHDATVKEQDVKTNPAS